MRRKLPQRQNGWNVHCALIVDDELLIREFIRAQLEAAGQWQCLEASNGKLALNILKDNHGVEIVITDVLMPQMDGLQLIRALRHSPHAPKVLAISGGGKFRTDLYLEDASKLGADAVLLKPFTGAQLREAVNALLHVSTADEPLRTAQR